jgi:hypothetical protein
VPSAAPPTLAGEPSAAASPAGLGASVLPEPTPGVISPSPVAAPSANVGLAWIFASLALILGALGVGLLAFRRRSPDLQ